MLERKFSASGPRYDVTERWKLEILRRPGRSEQEGRHWNLWCKSEGVEAWTRSNMADLLQIPAEGYLRQCAKRALSEYDVDLASVIGKD